MLGASWLPTASDIVTVLVGASTISIAALRPWWRFRRFVLMRAFRPARSRSERVRQLLPHRWRWWRGQPADRSARPTFQHQIREPLLRALDGGSLLPVDILSHILASAAYMGRHGSSEEIAERMLPVFRSAATAPGHGLLARILYPEDVVAIRRIASDVSTHLRQFSESSAMEVAGLAADVTQVRTVEGTTGTVSGSMAQFASALTGALVLVDSSETRSRYMDDVLVWHHRSFRRTARPAAQPRGERSADTGTEGSRSYDDDHRSGACEHRSRIPDRRLGDFDRRVLTLRAVSVASSAAQGRVRFVLETSETCYLATELGDALPSSSGGNHDRETVGCKHLRPASDPPEGVGLLADLSAGEHREERPPGGRTASPSARDGQRPRYRGVFRRSADTGQVLLVTAYVSLISSDGRLVLVRRTSRVRQGQHVISASAGGVIEPDGEGPDGDVDDRGMPSPLKAVIREAVEEIGVALPSDGPKPVAVFLANVRNLHGDPAQGTDERAGRGQLVTTVLYLCRVDEDHERLMERMRRGDPALGAFEVDEPVLFGGDAAAGGSFAERLAREARQQAQWLDQHGLLSCLYAAAVVDGPDAAQAHFRAAFADRPWWAIGGGYVGATMPRVVRDPRHLIEGLPEVDGCGPLESIVPAWRDAWRRLPEELDRAATGAPRSDPPREVQNARARRMG